MAIAYESFAETAIAASNSVVITKPTGLAVGDYMFAQIIGGNGGGGAAITPPANWTAYYNLTPSLSGANTPCGVFYKEADSADVAASNFTFSLSDSGSQEYIGGGIVRVSGFGTIDGANTRTQTGGETTGTITYASGIDPTFPDGLILLFMFGGDNASITGAGFSSQAIATSNPTWTLRSSGTSSGINPTMIRSLYTAPRAAATAFGDISFSLDDGTGSGIGSIVIMLNLAPRINGSHTVVTPIQYFVNHPFLRNGTIEVDGLDPSNISESKAVWSNQDKPANSTFTNHNKP